MSKKNNHRTKPPGAIDIIYEYHTDNLNMNRKISMDVRIGSSKHIPPERGTLSG